MAKIVNERQVAKKRRIVPPFFGNHKPYTIFNPTQQDFLEDLMLYIAEGYHLLLSIENPWLKFNTWVQV
jgi:hypothetical protein